MDSGWYSTFWGGLCVGLLVIYVTFWLDRFYQLLKKYVDKTTE